jgi:hypothetical protein
METGGYRSLRLEETKHEGYLRFRLRGDYLYDDYVKAISAMQEACVREGLRKAVIDVSAFTGELPDFDRYNLGVHFAEVWGAGLKAAVLVPVDARVNRFFETTAVNRQARVQVFFEEQLAFAWLEKP